MTLLRALPIPAINGDDQLFGSGGNDRLIGGTGNDTLSGGTGDDLYDVDSTGDTITEASGQGGDTVRSSVTHTLAPNVEELFLLGSLSIDGTGNAEANNIVGNAAANTLNGLDGNDTLSGVGGDDILNGGAGNDRLIGGEGEDSLDGGPGNDLMQGGLDNDTYVVDNFFDQVAESASQGTDTVCAPF